MSGHSKWHNIQRTKGVRDAERGRIFTKTAREIIVAVKEGGGGDPASNSRLAAAVTKAKAANMPNDNIKRTIEKALGSGNADNYESIVYEGFGPGGVAVIVETMTDNRNRTASEMRHYFDKYGGNLGASGCARRFFDRKGVIIIDNEEEEIEEDDVITDALDAGAQDVEADGPVFQVFTAPESVSAAAEVLSKKYKLLSAQAEQVPQSRILLTAEEDIKNMRKMIEMFEDSDDVQNVYHNSEEPE
ncbi:MAG: YebC/PmpR family DNA-binding transcriptional regulator [Oscillospiraceae bacterium]|nr:YebC/PmpR family DNA-binding transcriptional regulator [Oscillospiraceae bacterium]